MTRQKGLTLLEICIALAIAALLLGLGLPNFHHYFLKQNADADARQILRVLQKTRELAVFSGKEMIFCGLDAEQRCVRNQIQRFAVFHDTNDNRRLDANEKAEIELELNYPGEIFLPASGARFIRYFNDGKANPMSSIILCPQRAEPNLIRRVTTNMSGRPYLARPALDGIVANANGSPVSCAWRG